MFCAHMDLMGGCSILWSLVFGLEDWVLGRWPMALGVVLSSGQRGGGGWLGELDMQLADAQSALN